MTPAPFLICVGCGLATSQLELDQQAFRRGECARCGSSEFRAPGPPLASETLDVEKLAALLTRAAGLVDGAALRETSGPVGRYMSDAKNLRELAAALPSLLRAQTRLKEITDTPLPFSVAPNRGHFHVRCEDGPGPGGCYDEATAKAEADRLNRDWLAQRNDRIALLETDLAQAQTERDAAESQAKNYWRLASESDDKNAILRAQVSALEAAQRETTGKIETLTAWNAAEIENNFPYDPSESADFVSRRSVLKALAPVLHVTPAQP